MDLDLDQQFVSLSLLVYRFFGNHLGSVQFAVFAGHCLVALREPPCSEQFALGVANVLYFVPEHPPVLVIFGRKHLLDNNI